MEFDPNKLIGTGLSAVDQRLLDARMDDEENRVKLNEQFQDDYTMGAPEVPEAQIVFNADKNLHGVAVRGAKFVCTLPKGYGGPGFQLKYLGDFKLVGAQPDQPPLFIDGNTGTCRVL